jgi:hypothetical protein
MPSFDDTRSDQEFQQRIAQARAGWMDQIPDTREPDLGVEGLRGSMFVRLLNALKGRRN